MAGFWGLVGVGATCAVGALALIALPGTGIWGGVGWILVAGALASFIGAGFSRKRGKSVTEPTPEKQFNVTSHHQSGGITAGEVHTHGSSEESDA